MATALSGDAVVDRMPTQSRGRGTRIAMLAALPRAVGQLA